MSDKELKSWVAGQLHSLLGFSESHVVSYILAVSKKHTAPESLSVVLRQQGLPAGAETQAFASQLLARLPRKESAAAGQSANQHVKQAKELIKKNRTYGLLDDDEEEAVAKPPAPAPAAPTPKAKTDRQLRTKRETSDDDDDDRRETTLPRGKRQRRAWEEDEEDDAEREERRAEEARERDKKEKEEFEARLRARDESKTKKVAEEKLSKAERREQERRKYETEEEKVELVPMLREVSRQEYLRKREEAKLKELEDELEDAKYLFDGVELTAKEKADLRYKEQVYQLAMERKKQLDAIHEDGYHMPDSYDGADRHHSRYDVAKQRYQEPEDPEQANPFAEQEKWEAEQMRRHMKVGALEGGTTQQQYDFLFEDAIDFIKTGIMTGEGDFDSAEAAKEKETKERADRAKNEHERIQLDRTALPVYPYREQFLQAVEEHQVVIIVAETGAGKTTQLPQYLHEAGYSKMGKIGCTQPRRVAAMSVAARVAQEMGVKLGNEVGYSIRFEDCTSDKTFIKYMTDGMLLREFLSEPDLASYSIMMIDEAHERTLHTDILFGLVKDIARFRPDLKLLISSATMDAEKFSEYFDYAPIFKVPGRRYPVDILYTKAPEADYIDAAIVTVLHVHATQPAGDVLVFLSGQEEIEACEELLKQRTRGLGTRIAEMIIAPIYANLPSDLQAKIFEPTPSGARKVVLATNIAETSLTIDGIKYVIDPGFVKQNSYNPRSGMESLIITPVSKASANQRAGRAGRTSPGKCFRLYTAWSYENELEDNTVPEIQRTNLGNVVLMLKSLGIHDLMNFDFMDPPPAETLLRALESLYALGSLNDKGELTKLGRRMAEFPLDPMLSKMLLASETYGVSDQIATICAMVSIGGSVFYRPKDKQVFADNAHKNFSRGNVGDHIALLNVFDQWAETSFSTQWCFENYVQVRSMKRARDIRDQLVGLMERVEIEMLGDSSNHDAIRKSIAAGYFYNTSKLQKDGSYKTVKNPQSVHIHPSSSLLQVLPRWVVYHELVLTSKEYMRCVSEIKPEWLVEIAPHYYSKKDILEDQKKLPKGKGKANMDNGTG